eukprot:gene11016-12180_t
MIILDQDFKGLVIRNSSPLQMVDSSRYCKINSRGGEEERMTDGEKREREER